MAAWARSSALSPWPCDQRAGRRASRPCANIAAAAVVEHESGATKITTAGSRRVHARAGLAGGNVVETGLRTLPTIALRRPVSRSIAEAVGPARRYVRLLPASSNGITSIHQQFLNDGGRHPGRRRSCCRIRARRRSSRPIAIVPVRTIPARHRRNCRVRTSSRPTARRSRPGHAARRRRAHFANSTVDATFRARSRSGPRRRPGCRKRIGVDHVSRPVARLGGGRC